MKKLVIAFALIAAVGLLAGCQSKKTEGFDNADTASFDEATDQAATDIGNPPIPPEPVEAQ
jgi:outer membrane murein-binding lipoprotein Lpp